MSVQREVGLLSTSFGPPRTPRAAKGAKKSNSCLFLGALCAPWDGLILQAALDAGCTTLFSEDFSAGARFGGLTVVNPFASQAHEPAAAAGYAVKPKAGRR